MGIRQLWVPSVIQAASGSPVQARGSVSPLGALLPEAAQFTWQAMWQPLRTPLGGPPNASLCSRAWHPPGMGGHEHSPSRLEPVLLTEEVSFVTFPTVRLMQQA